MIATRRFYDVKGKPTISHTDVVEIGVGLFRCNNCGYTFRQSITGFIVRTDAEKAVIYDKKNHYNVIECKQKK